MIIIEILTNLFFLYIDAVQKNNFMTNNLRNVTYLVKFYYRLFICDLCTN